MNKKGTSVVFTGDIGFDRYMTGKWDDEDLLSGDVLGFLHGADHVVANVEGAVQDQSLASDENGKGVFFHTMDPAAVRVLKRMRADIWSLANNHTMDAGRGGIESTLSYAAECGAAVIGAGLDIDEASEPYIIDAAGGIALLGVGYMPVCVPAGENKPGVFAWNDLERIEKQIKKAKERCRWCVVVCHSGEEFTSLPAPYNREIYHKYISFGADAVVGHHPHVPMNYERTGKGIIFYSLGNFIFDTDYQRLQHNTDRGLLLKLIFTEDEIRFEPFGTRILRGPEHIVKGAIPEIFTDIGEAEYKKLFPMNAKAWIEAEKRRRIFLEKETFSPYSDADWRAFFSRTDHEEDEFVAGEHHDMSVYLKYADAADEDAFESSALGAVKEYIRVQSEK